MANRNNDSRTHQNNRNDKKTSPPTPSWLRYVFMIAAVVLLVVACYWLKAIVIPLLLAIFVAYIFDPVIGRFERFHIPRAPAIIMTIVALIAALVLVSILIAVTSTDDAQRIARSVIAFKEKIETETPELPAGVIQRFLQSKHAEQIARILKDNLSQVASYAADIGSTVGTKMLDAVTGLGRGVMWFVAAVAKTLLFVIVTFYLLKDFADFKAGALRLVPFERRERVVIVLGKIDELLHGFFRGQLLVSLSLAAIYAVGLSALGVPFALIIAIVGGLANIVPYLGLVLGLLPAVLLAVVAFGDVWHPLGAVAVFVVGQALEGTVLTPRIVGRTTNLHPVFVILSILVFAQVLGFVGLLLAVPTAAIAKVFVTEALDKYRPSEIPTSEVPSSDVPHRSSSRSRRPRRRRRTPHRSDRNRSDRGPKPNNDRDRSGRGPKPNNDRDRSGRDPKPPANSQSKGETHRG